MEFRNAYQDVDRAVSYAKLEFPGTYYLAYRDLPAIIRGHVKGGEALDFGCGAGRSTRFLRDLGFSAIGVDIAREMVDHALMTDPDGDYRVIGDGDFGSLGSARFDLILSAFSFDNIPTKEHKVHLFRELADRLTDHGAVVNLVSSPDLYVHEWASFTTKGFPENRSAESGDTVRIVLTDVEDKRPVVDILWSDEEYRKVFDQASLTVSGHYRPLARDNEPFQWINETRIPPWTIYVLTKR